MMSRVKRFGLCAALFCAGFLAGHLVPDAVAQRRPQPAPQAQQQPVRVLVGGVVRVQMVGPVMTTPQSITIGPNGRQPF